MTERTLSDEERLLLRFTLALAGVECNDGDDLNEALRSAGLLRP